MRDPIWKLLGLLGIKLMSTAPARADILIGTAGPTTGGMAWYGEQMQRGMDKKVAELNAAGGALGQQVELVVVDDCCDPEQAIAAAKKLVEARDLIDVKGIGQIRTAFLIGRSGSARTGPRAGILDKA